MALIILVILALSTLFPKVFSPQLRYVVWIIILLGLIIPFRPIFGGGLVIIHVPNSTPAASQSQTSNLNNIVTAPSVAGEYEHNILANDTGIQGSLQASHMISTIHVLVIVWAAVAAAILTYHIWRYIRFIKLIRRWGIIQTDRQSMAILQDIQTEKRIANKEIRLIKCDFISTSMIVGFLHPDILLPDKNYNVDELELIFRHELIHYKRGDLYVKLLSIIAISLNWFNPAIYLMCAAMQADCEASCDEAVIADVGGDNRQFYAEIIIDMIGSKTSGTALSTCFYGSKAGVKKRMEAIMNTSNRTKKITLSVVLTLIILIVLSGSILAFSSQETPELPQQQMPQYPTISYPTTDSGQSSTRQITSQRAREIAIEFVGHGTVQDITAFTEDGVLNFEVEVNQDFAQYIVQYTVRINGESGDIISLARYVGEYVEAHHQAGSDDAETAYTPTPQSTPTSEPIATPIPQPTPVSSPVPTAQQTPTPVPTAQPTAEPTPHSTHTHSRGNRPSNPAISLERAIEIAYADLAARGIDATYRSNSGMDWERGQWVWELLFRTQGERMPFIEFYINVDTGDIVKFEWDD